jgi:hypothetical protein
MFNTLLQRLNGWRDHRRTEKVLDRLDDHLLFDIGLYRIGRRYYPTRDGSAPATFYRAGPVVSKQVWSRDDLPRNPSFLGWDAVAVTVTPQGKAAGRSFGHQPAQQGRSGTAVRRDRRVTLAGTAA